MGAEAAVMVDQRTQHAEKLLEAFADRTGLDGHGDPARRYLWTDAFAVRVLLTLHRRTGRPGHLEQALELVDLVHHVLGRHRRDDPRQGWISGLSEAQGDRHPTVGGLRIGKPLRERAIDEPFDERLEWERDGQYFHYLTQWMHALDRLAAETRNPRWILAAIELARAACRGFVRRDPRSGTPRMIWKASVDLSRPLVESMGHLDPLDGFVAIRRVMRTARTLGVDGDGLAEESAQLRSICDLVPSWATLDPLGLGGLLVEASHLIERVAEGASPLDSLLPRVLADAVRSLEASSIERELDRPPGSRLAFRELGLAIGLRAIDSAETSIRDAPDRFGDETDAAWFLDHVERLQRHRSLADRLEAAWLDPAAQASRSWNEHLDIDAVMLAASLVA